MWIVDVLGTTVQIHRTNICCARLLANGKLICVSDYAL